MPRADNFNRTDTTSGLGTPSDAGSAWEAGTGTAGIDTNEAYFTTGSTHGTTVLQCGNATGTIEATLTVLPGGANYAALVMRWTDNANCFFLFIRNGDTQLNRIQAGGYTNIAAAYTGTVSAGDVWSIEVDASDNWTVKQNGVSRITATDSFNNTATKHGLGTYGDTTARWDDWSYTEGAATTYTLTAAKATSGNGKPSEYFTIQPNGLVTGTFTPASTVPGDTFTPATVSFTNEAGPKFFTVTGSTNAARDISTTNDAGLTDPAAVTLTVSANTDYESTVTGNWNAVATWNGAGPPGDGDTATIGSGTVVTDTAGATISGLTITGKLIIAANQTFTVNDDWTIDGPASLTAGLGEFVMEQGSDLVFDTTSANVVLTLTQACIFTVNGISGNRCTISKTGGNLAYAVASGDPQDSFQYTISYCDISDIDDNATVVTGGQSFPSGGGGVSQAIDHCTFDACGTLWRGAAWDDIVNDWLVLDTIWTNSPGNCLNLAPNRTGGTPPAGDVRVEGCAFDQTIGGNAKDVKFRECYFPTTPSWLQQAVEVVDCVFVQPNNTHTFSSTVLTIAAGGGESFKDNYFIADHQTSNIGNPHFFQVVTDIDIDGVVFELVPAFAIDTGDCIFGDMGASTVKRCLILPGATDGLLSGCLLNPGSGWNAANPWTLTVEHNTCLGVGAQLLNTENDRSGYNGANDPPPIITYFRSNLVACDDAGDSAYFVNDIFIATTSNNVDLINTTNTTHNYILNAVPFTDPDTLDDHDGFKCALSAVPTGPTTYKTGSGWSAGPDFVEPRWSSSWAVNQGLAAGGDTLRQKMDALEAHLALNPRNGKVMAAWVKAGWAPQDPDTDGTAHDSGTIGAVAFQAAGALTIPIAAYHYRHHIGA